MKQCCRCIALAPEAQQDEDNGSGDDSEQHSALDESQRWSRHVENAVLTLKGQHEKFEVMLPLRAAAPATRWEASLNSQE